MNIGTITNYVSGAMRELMRDKNQPTFRIDEKSGEPMYIGQTGVARHASYLHRQDPLALEHPLYRI